MNAALSLLAGAVVYGAVVTAGWVLADTAGLLAGLGVVFLVEHRLARIRSLTNRREGRHAHR